MFPFIIRFSKIIDKSIKPEQIKSVLENIQVLLNDKGADYFTIENDKLLFENKLFKLVSNWNLMAYIDAGFVELKKSDNDTTKITYGVKLISIWIISLIFTTIIYFSTKKLMVALIAFCFLGILSWLISILRHWGLISVMTEKIIDSIDKDEK
jgi:hypothetical protein